MLLSDLFLSSLMSAYQVIKKDAERAAAEKKRQGISDDQARGDIGIENDDAKRWEATKKTLSQHYDALHKKKVR